MIKGGISMKKVKYYISILVILSLMLSGCSNNPKDSNDPSGSNNFDTLKKMSFTYELHNDIVIPEGYEDLSFDSAFYMTFYDSSYKGFVAEIVPIEYIFYYVIDKDEDTGDMSLDGYAEVKCSIQKMSQKFNLTEYSDKDIVYVRQNIYLAPIDDEAFLEMAKSIGAYKNGAAIEGTYKVPNKYINESDYSLRIRDCAGMLLGDKPYYSYINFQHDIAYFSYMFYGLNEEIDNVPGKNTTIMKNFKEFLESNDPDLLSIDNQSITKP